VAKAERKLQDRRTANGCAKAYGGPACRTRLDAGPLGIVWWPAARLFAMYAEITGLGESADEAGHENKRAQQSGSLQNSVANNDGKVRTRALPILERSR
jgi:hypothetical protein